MTGMTHLKITFEFSGFPQSKAALRRATTRVHWFQWLLWKLLRKLWKLGKFEGGEDAIKHLQPVWNSNNVMNLADKVHILNILTLLDSYANLLIKRTVSPRVLWIFQQPLPLPDYILFMCMIEMGNVISEKGARSCGAKQIRRREKLTRAISRRRCNYTCNINATNISCIVSSAWQGIKQRMNNY